MLKRSYFHSLILVLLASCNSASKLGDAVDIIDGVPRKTIDTSILGVNAFFNDSRFGSIASQFADIKNSLRLGYVRVLMNWDDGVQASPKAAPNFGFYDKIIAAAPGGVDILVILTGLPSWMKNSANWEQANPRLTFVNSWVKAVVERYASNGSIIGFEIWNEPNQTSNPDNELLGLSTNAANYVEMLNAAHNIVRAGAPGKKVISAATTAINQNFPDSLDYNRAMRDAGADSFMDVWGVHYYGKEYENVIQSGGVADFLNGLSKPIWITESGAQGVNNQLAYGEEVWPFLTDQIPGIQRIYQYQYSEASPSNVTYGLRNTDSAFPVSDLYVSLRDRK